MAKVKKGNVVLHIEDTDVQRYLVLGYDHIKEDGTLIEAAVPNDVASLKRLVHVHQQTIDSLNKQIADLKTQVRNLTEKKTTKSSKSE